MFRAKYEQSVCLSLIRWILPVQDFHVQGNLTTFVACEVLGIAGWHEVSLVAKGWC